MADDPATPTPTAQGTLAKTPLPHLLLYVFDKQLTGTLELVLPDGEKTSILLADGFPTKVRTRDGIAYLGDVLVECGVLTTEQRDTSFARAKAENRLHGEVLRAMGLVDDAKLDEGLRLQIIKKIEHLFVWAAETTFSYFDGHDGLVGFGGASTVQVDPLPIVLSSIRHAPSWEHVHAALATLGNARIRLVPNARVERLALKSDEKQFVSALALRPRRLHDITQSGLLPPTSVQLLVYALLITKQIELLPEEAPSSSAVGRVQLQARQVSKPGAGDIVEERAPGVRRRDGRTSSPTLEPSQDPVVAAAIAERGAPNPAPKTNPVPIDADAVQDPLLPRAPKLPAEANAVVLTPEMEEMRATIVARAKDIVRQDYFEMLGVDRDAEKDKVQAAFFAQAKTWHPDRLPAALASVRDACSTVFSHLSEAHQTLCDPQKRAQYMTLIKDGGATPAAQEQITNILEAATNFQKAEICLKRNDLAQAEQLCRRAHDGDPQQPEYLALLAWIESQKTENQSPQATLERIEMLDEALSMNDKCERAYFYRGMLHKRMQNDKSAYRDFKMSAQLNPRNIDAMREVRLFNMRRGNSRTSAPPPPPRVSGGSGRVSEPPPPPPPSRRSKPPSAKPEGMSGFLGRLFKK